MKISIQTDDFDLGMEIAAVRKSHPGVGAIASFVGLVRDASEGVDVTAMTLEHYPGMAEKSIAAIVDEAQQRWPVTDVVVIHRVGRLLPADQIVLVIAASAHRADAFATCAFVMDFLKMNAPFWKKEESPEGSRWVEARPNDDDAVQLWLKQSH